MMDEDFYLDAEIPQWNELNCNTEKSFLNPNSCIDHYSHFESAFSSMLSSPAVSTAFPAASTTTVAASRYLLANNGHTSDSGCNSTRTSPFKPHLQNVGQIKMANLENPVPLAAPPPPFAADPGFPAMAAKFSCSGRSFSGGATPLGLENSPSTGNGKLLRVFSSPFIDQAGSSMTNKELIQFQKEISLVNGGIDNKLNILSGSVANSSEKSSVSEQIPSGETGCKDSNEMKFRKRKMISRGKMKADGIISAKEFTGAEDENSKCLKPPESCRNENGDSENETEKRKLNQKPFKDYIHVRARRGEATDSHSLAERARREKISERMKLLQELVPGCNKVIGKAVMLGEIINYVELLQRQVKFLSMKLASVNPGLDFNNMFGQSANTSQEINHLDFSVASIYDHRSHGTDVSIEPLRQSSLGVQLSPVDGLSDCFSQFPDFCEDDLHSIIQMGFGQNPDNFTVENPTWEAKGRL